MIQDIEMFDCSFVNGSIQMIKVTGTSGAVGWAEYAEAYPNSGVTAAIETLKPHIIGTGHTNQNSVVETLRAMRSEAPFGVATQAVAAIENALLDLRARELNISVAELLGGSVRSHIPVYWSHCGPFRMDYFVKDTGRPILKNVSEIQELGQEAIARGFSALKTNVLPLDDQGNFLPLRRKYWREPGALGTADDQQYIRNARRLLEEFRAGVGDDFHLMLDINYNLQTNSTLRLIRTLQDLDLYWLEVESQEPQMLRDLRMRTNATIASGESLYEGRTYRRFFEARAMDISIIDVLWNGFSESLHIARLAHGHDITVAPHNFSGHLASAMNLHFCSVVPNLSIMEFNVDGIHEREKLVDAPPVPTNGKVAVPTGPGWGIEVNEEAVRHFARNA